jgi:predicted nucleotidyltransferase
MDRLDESNRDTRCAYFVEEVILFGSYLRREERVTDIDLCISYCRKTQAKLNQTIQRMMRERHVDADGGYKLSVREIDDFLTARHPRFHTSDTGTIRRLGVPYKVLYRLPQAKAFLRLLTTTENRIGVKHLHDFLEKQLRSSSFRE